MMWGGSIDVTCKYFQLINGYFPDERRSPRVSALDVLKYASGENPCAALLIKKIPHLCIGNYLVLKFIYGWALSMKFFRA